MEKYDYLIVGGGAAGMAAALAAAEKGASVLLAEREACLGGILPQCIHRGFGLGYFGEDLSGQEYAARFIKRVECSGVKVLTEATVLEISETKRAVISSPMGLLETAFEKCVLACGCRERSIGSLFVGGSRPAGVFTAGAAQKMVNLGGYHIGERIVILGSGDIGQIMARRFTLLGKKVIAMVEKRSEPGGLARNRRDCIEAFNIPLILNATVDAVEGSGRLSGVWVRHLDSNAREFIPCDTLVTAIGLIPERELWPGQLPPWMKCVGNCDFVHEIVDTVTVQAEKLMREF